MVPRPDQDHTDLEKTLAFAIDERGATRVTVLAATGGRPDHAFENLALATRWGRSAGIELYGEDGRFVPVLRAGRAVHHRRPDSSPCFRLADASASGPRACSGSCAATCWTPQAASASPTAPAVGLVTVRVEGGALLVFLAEPGRDW